MERMKTSPAPWSVGYTPTGAKVVDANRLAVCMVTGRKDAWNADLLAAAPELLAALMDALDMLETLAGHGVTVSASGKAAMDRYRAAIAKATGSDA